MMIATEVWTACILLFAIPIVISGEPVTPVVIDTDGGADDAVGILLFLWNEENYPTSGGKNMRLEAITTVAGNVDINTATRNVHSTLEIAGRSDVRVYAGGASIGLLGTGQVDDFYGQDGFGDFLPPLENGGIVNVNEAIDQLIELSKQHAGDLELICLGPLTNLALAQRKDSDFLRRIKKIHMMGGTVYGVGSVKPGVEFNIHQDPEAADIILRESPSIINVMPFDPVFLDGIDKDWRENVLGNLRSKRIKFLNKAERTALDKSPVWSPADPQAVAIAIWPNLISDRITTRVLVETGGVHARGAFLIDHSLDGRPTDGVNCSLVKKINIAYYQELLLKAFKD